MPENPPSAGTTAADGRSSLSVPRTVVPPKHARRGWRWFAVLLVAAGGFWFCRQVILQTVASLLIVDQEADDYDYILVLNAEYCSAPWIDAAAELYREDPARRIVLVESRPERAVRLGVLPSYAERSRRVLESRGVPRSAVVLIPGEAADAWAEVELLRQWLADRPTAGVAALSGRFSSRAQRLMLDRLLTPEDAARVAVCALPDANCNECNWWHNRWSAKAFLYGWLQLAYACCEDGGQPPEADWNPDEYERTLRQSAAEVCP